ncbi:hypothetical protein GAMM_20026 [Gammaproteobacteria bacterium]
MSKIVQLSQSEINKVSGGFLDDAHLSGMLGIVIGTFACWNLPTPIDIICISASQYGGRLIFPPMYDDISYTFGLGYNMTANACGRTYDYVVGACSLVVRGVSNLFGKNTT